MAVSLREWNDQRGDGCEDRPRGGNEMNRIWRALVACVLMVGPVVWLPATSTDAAFQQDATATTVRGPAADKKDDPDDLCGNKANPRKQKKCHYNGWDLNQNGNDNDNGDQVLTDPTATGAKVTQDGLSVDLWRSTESPVITVPLVIAITAEGAAIERVWWWAEGPVFTGPFVDDLAFVGQQTHECSGAQPCAWSWPVVTRYLGSYMLHARIRDTTGREVQTDWRFQSIEKK
jgi:hypothetical protein